jgi:DNA-binding transcriptional regulator LsrR (DeoR family)
MSRPKKQQDLRLLTKVSKLYYEDNLNQDDIVARLHISRATISRLLAQAREAGIVKIVVTPPVGTYAGLEERLESRYHISEAIVTDVQAPDSPHTISRDLGAAAAGYLHRVLREQDVVGVSWGYTMQGMVSALEPKAYPGVQVVQMTGGIGKPESESHTTELCHRMARLLSCRLALLPAPGVVHSKEAQQVYLMDEHVRTAMSLLPRITLAFVGIGSLNSFSLAVRDETILTPADLDVVMRNGAVGDIALRFIDEQGRLVQSGLNERIIGISLEQIKNIPCVVGVAGGPDKTHAIRAALQGGLLDVLITDQVTAQHLL